MKKKLTFRDKLKMFNRWIKGYDHCAVECCNYCGDVNIKILDKTENGNIYKAKYQCLKCGATADATEYWVPKRNNAHTMLGETERN